CLGEGKVIAAILRDEKSGYLHNAYTFSPDGRTVVSGGGNGILSSYGIGGSPLGDFNGHTGDVWAVAVSADGRLLASGADDQTLRLWNIATRELIVTLFYCTDCEWILWT